MRTLILIMLSGFICLAGVGHSYAAGGGGGGGGGFSSTPSAPKYDPVIEYQKGLEALKKNDNKAAEKAFKRVLKVARKDANTNYLLGLALINQEEYKRARKPLERAVKYDSENHLARGYLAKAYAKSKKDKKAQKVIAELQEIKSNCDNCEKQGAIDRALMIATEASAAKDDLGLNSAPADAPATYLAAIETINRGQFELAIRQLNTLALHYGPHPDLLTYQGFAHRKLGAKGSALRFYKMALSIDSDHLGANEYLGEYFVEIGNLDKAQKQLDLLNSLCDFGCEEAEELARWIAAARS